MLKPLPPRRQDGMVLLMAIIVLVALTLGALALTRSVYTSNVIAGNLAFQRSATHSAELGIESALKWLEDNKGKVDATCAQTLFCKQPGYLAHRAADSAGHANWLIYWDKALGIDNNAKEVSTQAGNRVLYAIQRMCMKDGDPLDATNECIVSPTQPANNEGGEAKPKEPSPVYYRITVRVEGPRNTRSLVQAMVSL